jgi:hypothetical protein
VPSSSLFSDFQLHSHQHDSAAALLGTNSLSTTTNITSSIPSSPILNNNNNIYNHNTPIKKNQNLININTHKMLNTGNSRFLNESQQQQQQHFQFHQHQNYSQIDEVVFPGCYGPLHSRKNKEINKSSPLQKLLDVLPFQNIIKLSYLFNYTNSYNKIISKKRRIKIQIDDTLDWSEAYCLDNVGVSQYIKINDPLKGCQEVSFTINLAPGRLSKYTKIIRFLPRFNIINKLPSHSLYILQPTGFAGEASTIDVSSLHIRPYHLPAMFGERKISLQLDGYYRSVAFNIDQINSFNLQIKKKIELHSISHINTRGAPEYIEELPVMSSLGVFFETDWKEENVVVKSLQANSYAVKETNIKIGDVLVSIADHQVNGRNFELSMTILRKKLNEEGCTVVFRTIEEKIRLIRESALTSNPSTQSNTNINMNNNYSTDSYRNLQHPHHHHQQQQPHSSNAKANHHQEALVSGTISASLSGVGYSRTSEYNNADNNNTNDRNNNDYTSVSGSSVKKIYQDSTTSLSSLSKEKIEKLNKITQLINEYKKDNLTMELRVELKLIESSVMISIQPLNPLKHYEYRIENRSICYKIFYKQKHIIGNRWLLLNPGQSCNYIWEDPFKPHKLQVLCGDNILCPLNNTSTTQFKVKGKSSSSSLSSSSSYNNNSNHNNDRTSLSSYWQYLSGVNSDYQSTIINFDEIGYENELLLSHKSEQHLIVTVKSEGPIKTLLITPNLDNFKLIRELTYCSEFMKNQSISLEELTTLVKSPSSSSSSSSSITSSSSSSLSFEVITHYMNEVTTSIRNEQKKIIHNNHMIFADQLSSSSSSSSKNISNTYLNDLDDNNVDSLPSQLVSYRQFDRLLDIGITKLNQLEVEVLEAKELSPLVFGKMEDIYCQVYLNTDDFVSKAM